MGVATCDPEAIQTSILTVFMQRSEMEMVGLGVRSWTTTTRSLRASRGRTYEETTGDAMR